MLAIIASGLAGVSCGGGEPSPKKTTEARALPQAEPASPSQSVRVRKRLHGSASCWSARVRASRSRSAIAYTVRCAKPIEGRVRFIVGRFPLDEVPSRPGYRRIGSHPVVEGPGAARKRGTCLRLGGSIYCDAPAGGPVVVRGRIGVEPTTACLFGVSVRVDATPPCEDETCNGSSRVAFLAEGRPEGCPG